MGRKDRMEDERRKKKKNVTGFAIFSLFSNWTEKSGENNLENEKVKRAPFFLSFTFNNKGIIIPYLFTLSFSFPNTHLMMKNTFSVFPFPFFHSPN